MLLFPQTWTQCLLLLFAAVAAVKLLDLAISKYLQVKWNAKPPNLGPTTLMGLLRLRTVWKSYRSGYFPDFQKSQFDKLGCTFGQKMFSQKVIMTSNAHNVKAILSSQFLEFGIGPRSAAFRPLLGHGVFAADGHIWKDSRQMLRPQFAREQVGHVQALEPHLMTLVMHIRKHQGRPFDIQPLFSGFTFDSATEFLLGESVYLLRDESIGYDRSQYELKGQATFEVDLKFLLDYMSLRASALGYHWMFNLARFRLLVKNVHDFTMGLVQKALSLTPEEVEKRLANSYTILYELVKVTRDPITVRDQMLNVMLAGRSTTSSLLSSMFFELSRHPEVWSKLRSEVLAHFGPGDSKNELGAITFESLKRCTYLKWVVNETLRLYPPVAANYRQALCNTTLPEGGGPEGNDRILVRKNQIVVFHIYLVQRLERYYGPDADQYRPERWADLTKIGWAFMPFGSGPRVCLGQQFALTEASYVTVRLAQMFSSIESFNPNYPPRKTSNATMLHIDGVNVSFTEKSG